MLALEQSIYGEPYVVTNYENLNVCRIPFGRECPIQRFAADYGFSEPPQDHHTLPPQCEAQEDRRRGQCSLPSMRGCIRKGMYRQASSAKQANQHNAAREIQCA